MEFPQKDSRSPAIRAKMKGALVKVLSKARPQPRNGGAHGQRAGGYVRLAHSGIRKIFRTDGWAFEPRLDVAAPVPNLDPGADPVRAVALALEILSPASLRASVEGRPVTVTVPDEVTADVFRAALARSSSVRPTDRLIVIRVAGGD